MWIAAGLSAAILVHSLHNLGATFASISLAGFALSLAIAAGGLCLLAIAVLLSWSHERSVIHAELKDEIGHTLSAQELALLTGHWRQPLRRRSGRQANRMALYVELAVRKRALQHADEKRTAELHQEIAQIRKQLSRRSQDGPAKDRGSIKPNGRSSSPDTQGKLTGEAK